ncbi:MAG: hydrogenase formation protein HypD [Deltaproteobacteria bacterium]|nr:hydrogenase formation protein HypD [Deltaproteobacteria bacterium]
MKYLEEYRDEKAVQVLLKKIHEVTRQPWTLMEVCGGQTHAIIKYGLDGLLPKEISLIHGPGCPVCVTPLEMIDRAIAIASQKEVIFCSFGDMLRVPGSQEDLMSVRAKGADIRILYSPMDALKIAQQNPDKQVVFFAIGFETTAPANAMAVFQAQQLKLKNFSLLLSHVLVPPAMEKILTSPEQKVQAFLAAGHVCSIMGCRQYIPIVKKYRVPIVVTGFEPLDILQGVLLCVQQLEEGRCELENAYSRSVKYEGNLLAQEMIENVFRVVSKTWRGIGEIPQSGLALKEEYESFDAEKRFSLENISSDESSLCISGLILQGLKKPQECPAFGLECTPEQALGATMVSSEGACAAYYRYRQFTER